MKNFKHECNGKVAESSQANCEECDCGEKISQKLLVSVRVTEINFNI